MIASRVCTPSFTGSLYSTNLRREALLRRVKRQGCWIWKGARNLKGYGRIGVGSRKNCKFYGTHRVFKFIFHDVSLNDFMNPKCIFMHTCDNPPCCNPDHIKLGTQSDNMRDAIAKGRK